MVEDVIRLHLVYKRQYRRCEQVGRHSLDCFLMRWTPLPTVVFQQCELWLYEAGVTPRIREK